MSKFLAPIHTWLFNKIKVYEDLEKNLVKKYENTYGEDVKTLYKNTAEKYGYPLPDEPIEELIDASNIHGWLQNKISIAETRQAAFITEMLNNYNKEETFNIALELYAEQATKSAEAAKESSAILGAGDLYNMLNNYIIEGMPCDRVTSIITSTEDKVQWETERCLHKDYWETVGGDITVFYKLREAWIKSFIENLNSDFTYHITYNNTETAPILVHEIMKK